MRTGEASHLSVRVLLIATVLAVWPWPNPATADQDSTTPAAVTAHTTTMARQRRAKGRSERLKAGVQSFQMRLDFAGEEAKPYYRLTLTVAPVSKPVPPWNVFDRHIQITETQAKRIIGYLEANDSFLKYALEFPPRGEVPLLPWYMDNYVLTVATKDFLLWDDWGWGPEMEKRLTGLRGVLEGDAREGMDLLSDRLRETIHQPE